MDRIVIAILFVLIAGCAPNSTHPQPVDMTMASPDSPSPEVIAEAKRNPNGWVYKIVGEYGPEDAVPPEAIAGAWKVDENGNITGDFKPNPNFKSTDP